jgi:aerobic carbon-monoxide dehydrogenase small subunit
MKGMGTLTLELDVNGRVCTLSVLPSDLLVDVLRQQLSLRGTNVACDTAQCGACTVLVDGQAVKACNLLALQVQGRRVTTIEGISPKDGTLHPMQEAFSRHHALQCGYCTPGFVMRALAMVNEPVPAQPEAVRHALAGNLCRCTGYQGIVDAICEGLNTLRACPEIRGLEP